MSSEEERINELIKALNDESIRKDITLVLGKIGEPSLPALKEALQTSDNNDQKILIIKALGMIGKKSVPFLLQLFKEENNIWIQSAIIRAFKNMGSEATEAVPTLFEKMLYCNDDFIKFRLISALVEIGYSTENVSKIILEEIEKGKHQLLIYNIVDFNNNIINLPGEQLVKLLRRKDLHKLHLYYKLIRELVDEATIQALIELLNDNDKEIQLRALISLRVLGNKASEAIPELKKAMLLKKNDVIKFEIAYTLLIIEGLKGSAMKELLSMKEKELLYPHQIWKLDKQIKVQQNRFVKS
ncbi:MAG: hypothetical protein FK734_08890 [Asgard group archaeon]|nr:hypothetical protein [Asgard group archaeon]